MTFAPKHREQREPESRSRPPLAPRTPEPARDVRRDANPGSLLGADLSQAREVLRTPGSPLPPPVREQMEGAFGATFSHVRVHADARAADSAEAIDALAYTVGSHIVFGAGQQPGDRLLAHELAHVLQQGPAEPAAELRIEPSDAPAEREASAAADAFAAGRPPLVGGLSPGALRREAAAAAATESPDAVIDRHTHGLNLREEELADDLRGRVITETELVLGVFRRLASTDRDDVAVALLEGASDEQIVAFNGSEGGRRVLAVLLGELSSGVRMSDEKAQQDRVLALVSAQPVPEEAEAAAEGGTTEQPEDIVKAHRHFLNLRERELAIDLLRRLEAGQGALVGRVLDALSDVDRDDVATHLLEVAEDDARVQAIARTPSGRALLLRLVRDMSAGVTTADEQRQMQRVMKLVSAADREAGPGGPVAAVDIEVLTFLAGGSLDIVGGLIGARGHTVITVGGLTYSYELGWRCGRTRDEYLRANQWRDAIGQVLKVEEKDAKTIQERLDASCGKGFYAITGDICTDASARVLEQVLPTLGGGDWDPGAYVATIEGSGLVRATRFYPRRAAATEGTLQRASAEGGWQDVGAGRPKPGEAGIDVERLMQEQRDVVLDEILVSIFLAISQDEISMVDGTTLKYTPRHRLEIAYSRKQSVVPWHCTDLVMNSAWRAGFVTPTGRGGFWEKSTATLGRVKGGHDPLVKEVPVPRDDPRTPQDERKKHLRPGDVLVWGAHEAGGFGHQMIIIERGETGGKVVVREAGASVEPRAEESLDPPGRDEAVYRFLKFDPVRVSQGYTRDMTYRQRFIAAFEQSSLPAREKDRYRR
jgi:hypothetical protein